MTDLEIARSVTIKHITDIAEKFGISPNDIEMYGKYKAKIPLTYIDYEKVRKSNLILVTAISPTPAGEGKTTMSIGIAEAFNRLNKKATVVLREPSLGPVFGIKGGATGGGYAQVLPLEDINLHFTGDFSAIEKAHNLLSAVVDNNIQSKTNSLGIDPRTITWKRVIDMNDRALRKVVVGLGGSTFGIPRETGFDITAASEVMAILCISKSLKDLKNRLENIFIGYTFKKDPVYAKDLKVAGAMAALLKDAIKPNLVQTLEGNPAIIHGGPFANIAQGTNSVIATLMGMSHSEYTVTEAGFGFDLGGEKFLDIKCQSAGISPKAIVLTTTIKALKYHGGASLNALINKDISALKCGLPNLEKHLQNIQLYGIEPIIALNKYATDSDEEINVIKQFAKENNVSFAVADVWAKGGEGALDLVEKIIEETKQTKQNFKPLYKWDWALEDKISIIAKSIYGAKQVDYSPKAIRQLAKIKGINLENLPICIAKTQTSLSDNPKLLGRPKDFRLNIREIEIAAGAGFIIPIAGDIMRMPGLPAHPASENIDISDQGEISGLF